MTPEQRKALSVYVAGRFIAAIESMPVRPIDPDAPAGARRRLPDRAWSRDPQ